MIDYDKRRAQGYARARLAYDDGDALPGLIRLVNYSVALEEKIAKQNERIDQLEEENKRWQAADSRANEDLTRRMQQLEEALEELRESFVARRKRAERLVESGELNDYWRGNSAALAVCLDKLATLLGGPQHGEEAD